MDPAVWYVCLSRGMRPNDTSLLIDGFRLRDAGSPQGDATAFLGDLLLVDTDRIEVLRGSGASLYGTACDRAESSTSSPQAASQGPTAKSGAEGGGLGLFRGFAKLSGSALQDQRLRYSLGAAHLNVTSGVDGNDRSRNSVLHGLLQYRIGAATEISGRILANDSFAQLNDTPYAAASLPDAAIVPAIANVTFIPSPDDPDSRRAGGYLSGLFALTHNWSPAVSTRISYQAVTTRRDNRDGPAGTQFEPETNTSDRFDGRLDTMQARTDLHVSRNWITAGYEWEREAFDSISQPANARLRVHQASHSAFVQDQLQLLDRRLQISFSGRLQEFQLNQPRFSDNTVSTKR